MAKSKEKVLVVAAHPDDEVLGCGGTMAKHAQNGDDVHVLILAEGLTSRDPVRKRKEKKVELSALAKSAHKANKILGVKSLTLHDFPDNRMDKVALLDVIKVVENKIQEIKPGIVYTHHKGDVNVDHRITHEATITACRPQPGHSVHTLLFFELPSSTEWRPSADQENFHPEWYVNITGQLNLKLKALQAYASEMRAWPHPRSYKAVDFLARWRGATAGVEAAESFMLGRRIVQ